jgi:hypothetical protein
MALKESESEQGRLRQQLIDAEKTRTHGKQHATEATRTLKQQIAAAEQR